MPSLGTCLWFDDQGEDAAKFYTSIFPNSRITRVTRYPSETPSNKPIGSVMTVDFELDGHSYLALNGGPEFTFSEAVSIVVQTADQAETDHYWQALLADGGAPGPCGWLKDKFGLSWQVYPAELDALMADPDQARAARAAEVMLQQSKIDLEAIRAAADAG